MQTCRKGRQNQRIQIISELSLYVSNFVMKLISAFTGFRIHYAYPTDFDSRKENLSLVSLDKLKLHWKKIHLCCSRHAFSAARPTPAPISHSLVFPSKTEPHTYLTVETDYTALIESSETQQLPK